MTSTDGSRVAADPRHVDLAWPTWMNEQPGAVWRLLGARSTTAVAAPLIALGLAGWYLTVGQARDMSGMVTGLGQVGTNMPNAMTVPAFMGMWLWMMMAMMLPAIGPVVIAERLAVRTHLAGALVPAGFIATYLAAWLLIGLVPLAAFFAFGNRAIAAQSPALRISGGTVLVIAGLYQFTPWKSTCLRTCRAPLAFVNRFAGKRTTSSVLRAGVSYGAYCVGSCWALMAVLVVVGLMNLAWMAVIAIVFVAEKNWRHSVVVTRLVGGALAVLGLAVAVVPNLLPTIAG